MLDIHMLGERIKELRLKKGLTQTAFADMIHVSFQAVSNWERGISPPDLDNLIAVSACFGVSTDDLLCPQRERLALGVDGGGTKTEFAVVTEEGRVLWQLTLEGCNPNDVGIHRATELLCQGIGEAVREFPSICAVFCGIAGVGTGNNISKLTQGVKSVYPRLAVRIETDSANLFALDDDAGMVMISGTGSVVFVKRGEECIRLGGWGYLLDQAGSAYDIGRDAIAQALAEEDALMPSSTMSLLLQRRLEVSRVWDAVARIYAGGRPFIASLAGVVFEAYGLGDPNAVAIVDRNGARLAQLLELGVRSYGASPKVVASGGMFAHFGKILIPQIQKYTDVVVDCGSIAPIGGACRRACALMGDVLPADDFFGNFKESYRGEGS